MILPRWSHLNITPNSTLQIHLALFWLWIGAALLMYCLPWIVNPGSGLTVNGYDLAEWTSLHSAVRLQPLLYTSLFLRFPLTLVTLWIALYAPKPRWRNAWFIHACACFLLVIAQLPPLEFILQMHDPNYQQQFVLAVVSLVGSIVGLSGITVQYRLWLMLISTIMGLFAALMGYEQAANFMRQFHLPAELGLGLVGMVVVFVVLLLHIIIEVLKSNRAALPLP